MLPMQLRGALSTPTNAVRAHTASLAKESSWGHKDGLPKEAVGPGPLSPGGVSHDCSACATCVPGELGRLA